MERLDETSDVDVVVVGFGAAGLTAAISAHDAGASVVVLEKMPRERAGGNTRVSGQVWFCPTDVEKAERHFRALAGEYPVEEEVVAAWARGTAGNSDWLLERAKEAGDHTPLDDDDPYTGDRTDHVRLTRGQQGQTTDTELPYLEFWDFDGADCGSEYVTIGGHMGFSRLWLLLRTCLEDRAIPVLFATAAERLDVGADGVVVGVVVRTAGGDERTIRARGGVVIASGGFAANAEMTRNYLRLPNATPWGSPGNTGDGIRMAQRIGADLAHPYNYMSVPGLVAQPDRTGHRAQPRGPGFIHVGADARRFADETADLRHGKALSHGTYDFAPGGPMWTIFDERTRLAGPLVPARSVNPFGWSAQVERYAWSDDNSEEIERGWIARGDTPGALAEQLGLDPATLEAEVAEYNEWARSGRADARFGRPAATMETLEPPYYGYEWAQLLITTLGGIRKDADARVLDSYGAPIAGLYCAGDVASSYSWCLGGGMGLGDALAFGRIAGVGAARRAATTR
jgi:succinate dehydrogenase/fumarate reductase flavoprotein subunit